MYIQKTCGGCGASIEMDTGMLDGADTFQYLQLEGARFSEAHVACGFVTPVKTDKKETTKLYSVEYRNTHKETE